MTSLIPFNSLLLRDMVSIAEMRAIWTDENMIQRWMDVEGAITEAQAELGIVPENDAKVIIDKLSLKNLSIEHIHKKLKTTGHLMVAFLKAFRDVCGLPAEHFHVGPTTQDILDTGLTLQMKESHEIIMKQMLKLENILCHRALEFKDTIVMGRTHQQYAVPITFGFTLAVWASEIADHIERAKESEKRWLYGNLSGAVGTQNALVELCGIETTRKLQDMVCKKLRLNTPMIDLHSRTDRFAEAVTNLSELCSSLGEFGINISSWQRTEVMEIEEPHDSLQYFSSTMPNKVNPEPSEQIQGLATIVRSFALAIQDIQMLDNRDATRIPIEYTSIPLSYMMTSKALETIIRNITGLIVNKNKMLENLTNPNALGQAATERLMIAIYKKTGKKDQAHSLLHEYTTKSRENKLQLKYLIQKDEYMSKLFTREELEKIFDLKTYTGTAAYQTEDIVKSIFNKRKKAVQL